MRMSDLRCGWAGVCLLAAAWALLIAGCGCDDDDDDDDDDDLIDDDDDEESPTGYVWELQTVFEGADQDDYTYHLSLDPGVEHLVFTEVQMDGYDFVLNKLQYAELKEKGWTVTELDSAVDYYMIGDVALDSSGAPHVIRIGSEQGGLVHSTPDNDEWVHQTIEPDARCGGELAAIIDDQDRIHAIWFKFVVEDKGTTSLLMYALYDGAWHISELHSGTRPLRDLRLAAAPNGTIYAAFVEEINEDDQNDRVNLLISDDATWERQTIEDYYGPVFVDLKLDSAGTPHLLLLDPLTHLIALKAWDNGQWLHETVQQLEQRSYTIALAYDNADAPQVVFDDAEDSQIDSRLYYTLEIEEDWPASLIDTERLVYEARLSWAPDNELYTLYSVDSKLKLGHRVAQ